MPINMSTYHLCKQLTSQKTQTIFFSLISQPKTGTCNTQHWTLTVRLSVKSKQLCEECAPALYWPMRLRDSMILANSYANSIYLSILIYCFIISLILWIIARLLLKFLRRVSNIDGYSKKSFTKQLI